MCNAIAQPLSRALPPFAPVFITSFKQEPTHIQAERSPEQIGFGEIHHITLKERARHCFYAQPLPAASKSSAIKKILKAGGKAQDVKISFVDNDVSSQTCIRVDPRTKHKPASAGFFDKDVEIGGTWRLQ